MFIIFFLLFCLITQYFLIFILFLLESFDDSFYFFESKKTFLNSLIPFYFIKYIYNSILYFIEQLKKHYKEL